MISRVSDLGTERLKELALSTDWQKVAKSAALETSSEILRAIQPGSEILKGAEASEFLEKLIPVTENAIIKAHSAYGDLKWLWYLRRIPRELLEGSLGTTFAYDLALAEAISGQMPEAKIGSHPNQLHYPVDKYIFRHLCRFVGHIKLLSELHCSYRRVGKGASLKFESGIPRSITDKNIEDAIRIYDLRHEAEQSCLGSGLGLSSLETDYTKMMEWDAKDNLQFILTPNCSPMWMPVSYPDDTGMIIEAEVEARYFISFVAIEKVLDPYQDKLESEPDYLKEIVPILQFQFMLHILIANIPWAIGSILKQGYFLTKIEISKDLFDCYLPEINSILQQKLGSISFCDTFDTWFKAASLIKPNAWPLKSGGFVRTYSDMYVLFDTASASNALIKRIEVDKTHSILGNKRASHFEIQCQEIINKSKWKPAPEIAAYRGKTLRYKGKHITDIDAIGAKDKTLLLVSCKSVVYDSDYDLGKHSTVRNVRSTIDPAVDYWLNLMDFFRSNPVGDNFDFSEFESILGVVCTPFAVYSSTEETLSFVAEDLRACLSSSELETWLSN